MKSKMNICEQCGYHLQMSSSERIELLIDPDTWDPMDEDMFSLDAIGFSSETDDSYQKDLEALQEAFAALHKDMQEARKINGIPTGVGPINGMPTRIGLGPGILDGISLALFYEQLSESEEEKPSEKEKPSEEEKPYEDRIASYQKDTGLTKAVQTGVGQINGIPVAIGVMDFDFLGGSMGSVVGEKITHLIEYATNHFLPLIIVCALGGARMQEGSLSLMQMAKISSALYDYQSNKKLLYVSILTSPTTSGVTTSFGMLGDIIIAEPNSYIAFAGKRVIEEIIKEIVPEDSQVTESLFEKGLFDLIVPRNLLKSVLGELVKLHAFFPLNSNSK